MASSTLIGTAPDQVPTNGDLGDLAFQNKDSVEFYDGRGGLGHLELTALSKQINVSATDVFVYDTSKDSDGGAWRNRCQHTSWYNEELNTATRGSRREFPSVAIIVATTSSVTIYDGDDPTMPMWMVFIVNTNYWLKHVSSTTISVSCINGVLVTGGNGVTGRVSIVEFIADRGHVSESGYNYKHTNISRRNIDPVGSAVGSIFIVNISVNDVATTVLPNAPIDAATGLPIPTIAVATDGGVSIIKDNGSVVNVYETAGPNSVHKINFRLDNKIFIYTSGTPGIANFPQAYSFYIPANSVSTEYFYALTPTQLRGFEFWGGAWDNLGLYGNRINVPNSATLSGITSDTLSNTSGLFRLNIDNTKSSASSHAQITSKFNTGYMPGNIKGAWLSDTTQETLVVDNLVTNGTFDSNTTGWSAVNGAILSVVSGAMRITSPSGQYYGQAQQWIYNLIPGRQYVLSLTASNISNAGNWNFLVRNSSSSNIVNLQISSGSGFTTFTAPSDGVISLQFESPNMQNASIDVDNVVLRLADSDRSVNNKGLQIFGSITKTPVATGADLVGYSGFSSSNYLKQPPNPDMHFGSDGYSVMLWAKTTTVGCAIGRGPSDTSESMNVYFDPSTYGIYFDYGNAAQYVYAAGIKTLVTDGNWHFVVCHVNAGQRGVIWVDGIKAEITGGGAADSTFVNDSSWETYVGIARQPVQPIPFVGSLALVRVSATIPSAEQINKIYNDERHLFQENAKATLYGTSDAVTALAYDENTDLLHVGTSSGRSVFKGLRRIDNTTDAVGSAISAVNGLVVEE